MRLFAATSRRINRTILTQSQIILAGLLPTRQCIHYGLSRDVGLNDMHLDCVNRLPVAALPCGKLSVYKPGTFAYAANDSLGVPS